MHIEKTNCERAPPYNQVRWQDWLPYTYVQIHLYGNHYQATAGLVAVRATCNQHLQKGILWGLGVLQQQGQGLSAARLHLLRRQAASTVKKLNAMWAVQVLLKAVGP
jgi:hypothetical protein